MYGNVFIYAHIGGQTTKTTIVKPIKSIGEGHMTSYYLKIVNQITL